MDLEPAPPRRIRDFPCRIQVTLSRDMRLLFIFDAGFSCYDCSVATDDPVQTAFCHLMSLSVDPYARLSVMATMSIALVSVASSLRWFGENKANFSREHDSGLSTAAYYLGLSAAHFLVSLLATLAFLLPAYALILTHASFYQLYFMLLLVYISCSGVGFACSIFFRQGSVGTIMAVLFVLGFMLFNGALLANGVAVPYLSAQYVLWVPIWVSPLRWAYELCYLILVSPLAPFLPDPYFSYATVMYGFSFSNWFNCWISLLLLAFVLRLLPFIVLLTKERY